jgi:hypothetical protein
MKSCSMIKYSVKNAVVIVITNQLRLRGVNTTILI